MMRYKDYVAKVEFDDEAGLLHGEVINTRDVITFQGQSVDETRRAFQESVDAYLAFCAKRGEEPEKPFSGKFMVRVSSALHQRVFVAAQREEKSLNAWVAEVLDRASASPRSFESGLGGAVAFVPYSTMGFLNFEQGVSSLPYGGQLKGTQNALYFSGHNFAATSGVKRFPDLEVEPEVTASTVQLLVREHKTVQ